MNIGLVTPGAAGDWMGHPAWVVTPNVGDLEPIGVALLNPWLAPAG